MLKKTLIFLGLVTACVQSAYASDFKAVVNPEDGSVFAVGKTCENKKCDVFVTVAYPGADIENLSADLADISYIKSINTDSYGNFEFVYTLDKIKTGEYSVNFNDGCGYSGHKGSFLVSSKSNAEDTLSEFNELLGVTNVSSSVYEGFVGANRNVFGIEFDDEYEACDENKVWAMMKEGAPYSSNTDVFKKFNQILSAMTIDVSDKTAIAGDVGEYIIFADAEIGEMFDSLDGEGLKRLYSNIENMKFEASTFSADFRKMLIVELFNKTDRNITKENIEKYAQEIGLDIAGTSNFGKLKNPADVYIGIANYEGFKNYDDIKKVFNELVSECRKKENNNNNSSSGSSGGGGGGVSVVIMPSANVPGAVQPEGNYSVFNDIGDVQWAKDSIEYLYEKGIVNGVNQTQFMPERNVTREEFVKMIVLAFDVYDENAVVGFNDISYDAWYAPYVASGVKVGIVNGVGEGNFGVGQFITRQDMTAMLYRVIQNMGIEIEESAVQEFTDKDFFATYAKESIEKLSAMGIVNGVGEGKFAPESPVTRAMAATVIARIINR